jgi:hypothetical protein
MLEALRPPLKAMALKDIFLRIKSSAKAGKLKI